MDMTAAFTLQEEEILYRATRARRHGVWMNSKRFCFPPSF